MIPRPTAPDHPVVSPTKEILSIRCPLCDGTEGTVLLWGRDMMYDHPDRFAVVACGRCGLPQSWPELSPEALAPYYPDSYFAAVPAVIRPPQADRILRLGRALYRRLRRGAAISYVSCRVPPKWIDLALPHPQASGRLLDVGSGCGNFLAGALGIGWRAEALDASPKVREVGHALKIPAHQGVLEQVADRMKPGFDLISFNHVLEHVATPVQTLKTAKRLLNPGGVLRIQIPLWRPWCVRRFGIYWSSLDLPRHRWNFRPVDLDRAARQAGFNRLLFLPETGTHILSSSLRLWLRHHTATARWASLASVDNRALRAAMFPVGFAAAILCRPFEATFYVMEA